MALTSNASSFLDATFGLTPYSRTLRAPRVWESSLNNLYSLLRDLPDYFLSLKL